MPTKGKPKKNRVPVTRSKTRAGATAPKPRTDRQEDDEYCTCCEEFCDCGDCQACKADTEKVVPVKTRWVNPPRGK